MSLVVFTAFVGMVIAPGGINPVIGFAALLCIAVGAGAAGALNMWYDADIDRIMRRTAGRPGAERPHPPRRGAGLRPRPRLRLGRHPRPLVNSLAAALLAFTIFFYVVVYTMWLKRWTPQNIVIGGAAGALPPVIGWAAATGSLDWKASSSSSSSSCGRRRISGRWRSTRPTTTPSAGVPMLPVVAGVAATKRQILIYSLRPRRGRRAPGPGRHGDPGLRHRRRRRLARSSWRWRGGSTACGRRRPRCVRPAGCSPFRSSICFCCSPSCLLEAASASGWSHERGDACRWPMTRHPPHRRAAPPPPRPLDRIAVALARPRRSVLSSSRSSSSVRQHRPAGHVTMTGDAFDTPRRSGSRLGLTAAVCVVFVAGMVGMSFAAVPLYRIFCQVTGYRRHHAARRLPRPAQTVDRNVTVRFDANVANGLGWSFRPRKRHDRRQGRRGRRPSSSSPRTGPRRPRPAPPPSTSRPTRPAPISTRSPASASPSRRCSRARRSRCRSMFFVDPVDRRRPRHWTYVDTITLSYTFFPPPTPAKPVAAAPQTGRAGAPL